MGSADLPSDPEMARAVLASPKGLRAYHDHLRGMAQLHEPTLEDARQILEAIAAGHLTMPEDGDTQ